MTTKRTTTKNETPQAQQQDTPTAEVKSGQEVAPQQSKTRTFVQELKARGIDWSAWNTLQNSLFPGARPESILMVIDYCKARNLDPLKKPCHIVRMEVYDTTSGEYVWRDVVLPGIYELRTTAHRTREYLGHTAPEFGPEIDFHGVAAPEWCSMIVKRLVADGRVAEFPALVWFAEVCGMKDHGQKVNQRWTRAPRQMIVKCTEAAALREAFPEELGGQMAAEEVDNVRAEHGAPQEPKPSAPTQHGTGADPDELNRELGLTDEPTPEAQLDAAQREAAAEANDHKPM